MAINAAILRTNIIMFVQTLVYVDNGIYSAWDSRTFDFSHRDDVDGSLIVDNARISLTMGPFEPFSFATVLEDDDGNFKACVHNVTFPNLNLTFDYVADLGINGEIPIYGTGSYSGGLNDVATTFCWLLASTGEEILDFDINVLLRHGPSSLSGFYNNEELDPIIRNILTQAKRVFAMWNNYEPECSSKCILNPVFFFMTNYLIHDVDKSAEFTLEECGCLMRLVDIFASEISLDEQHNLTDIYSTINYLIEENGELWENLDHVFL